MFAVTADRAGAVVETGGGDGHFAEAADAALAVVEQCAAEVDVDVAELAGDRAFQAVVEGAAAEAHAFPAGEQTVLVVQVGRFYGQLIVADQVAAAVIETVAGEAEAVDAGDFALLVIQVTHGGDAQHAFAVDHAVLVIQVAQMGNAQPALAADHSVLVIQILCAGAQIHIQA
ncbi:hypothetical protein D3C78_1309710 [compost metagenome]